MARRRAESWDFGSFLYVQGLLCVLFYGEPLIHFSRGYSSSLVCCILYYLARVWVLKRAWRCGWTRFESGRDLRSQSSKSMEVCCKYGDAGIPQPNNTCLLSRAVYGIKLELLLRICY
ncbi:hypothetical protein V8C42DRAFT_326938 [Trichoderma barbatum]